MKTTLVLLQLVMLLVTYASFRALVAAIEHDRTITRGWKRAIVVAGAIACSAEIALLVLGGR